MPDLNNREMSFLIWVAAIAVFLIVKSEIRTSMLRVVQAIFQPKLLVIWIATGLYVVATVILLSSIGIWQTVDLKTTLVWFFTFALASILEVDRISQGKSYFSRTILELISFTVLVEFFVSLHTFSLPVELLLLPIVSIVIAMRAYADLKDEYATAKTFLNGLLAAIGAILLLATVLGIYDKYSEVASSSTVKDFFIPTLLTVLFLPFTWGLHIIFSYEIEFLRLSFAIKNPVLLNYTKRKSVLAFGCNIAGLRQFVRQGQMFNFNSEEAVDAAIIKVKRSQFRQKTTLSVPSENGWHPETARCFLSSFDVETSNYQEGLEDWCAQSRYIEFNGTLPNNLAYYVIGNECAATELKLVLNVNSPLEAQLAEEKFQEFSAELCRKALPFELPLNWEGRFHEDDFKSQFGGTVVRFWKENWVDGIPNGYTRSMQLSRFQIGKNT